MELLNDTADRSIGLSRLLNAPVEVVWMAWTQPEAIAKWWGPDGFSSTVHSMNLEPGGEWRLTMQGPDGKKYANRSEFMEIEPLQKIVFQHFNPHYLSTIIFEAQETKTLLNWTMLFESTELFETVVKVFKADEGLTQNVSKLEKYLQSQ